MSQNKESKIKVAELSLSEGIAIFGLDDYYKLEAKGYSTTEILAFYKRDIVDVLKGTSLIRLNHPIRRKIRRMLVSG